MDRADVCQPALRHEARLDHEADAHRIPRRVGTEAGADQQRFAHPRNAEGLAEVPYDKLIEDDYVWVGTPAQIIDRIESTRRVCDGLTEIGITVNAGGAPHWMAIKNQELFAHTVMPHFAGGRQAAGTAA